MPTDACQYFYECANCGVMLKPKEGDCCVFCSYGSVPCPPIQESREIKEVNTMKDSMVLIQPNQCFCDLSEDEVRPWVIKKFVEHRPTVELLRSTEDPQDREIISMVAMMDLDDDEVTRLMARSGKSEQHVLACRSRVKGLWQVLATKQ